VVFFGEQVPLSRVSVAEQLVASAEAIVVAGSSLTVNSGLRLVKQAKKLELPIVILNLGETRADAIADVRLNASTTDLMRELFK
jgi:NAD-dependent SIR2 family protein deacetylase